MKLVLSFMAALAISLGAPAAAQSFTEQDVEKFITAMEAFSEVSDDWPDDFDVEVDTDEGGDKLARVLDDEGRLVVFSTMLGKMKTDDRVESDIRRITRESGFRSPEAFGVTADDILMAYIAIEADIDASDLEKITPEMLEMMPADVRAQMEPVFRFVEAIEAVPEADIAMIEPFMPRIQAVIDD